MRVNVPKVVSARRPQHKPKLGQHFLASESFALQIVDALGDISQNTVLEIGPGRGILTSLLAKRVRRLIAVELDRVLAAQLRLRFGMFSNIEVIEADILSVNFDSLFGPKPACAAPALNSGLSRSRSSATFLTTSRRIFFCACSTTRNILRASSSWCSAKWQTALPLNPAAAITGCSPLQRSFTPAWRNSLPCPRRVCAAAQSAFRRSAPYDCAAAEGTGP